jgi:Zn-dependent M28 family amino/carboxypeptidase
VTRTGDARQRHILLIGAHYDSVSGSPGANDNASGVAALLEISREFAAIASAMTVRFVAFVNEEPPFFMSEQQGSMVYAKQAHDRGDDIRLMASLETIGCYSDQPGSQHYPPLLGLFYPDRRTSSAWCPTSIQGRRCSDWCRPSGRTPTFPLQTAATVRFIPGMSWSDHRSFWHYGYRALMITDTAPYRYAHYHAASDTPDKIAYPELSRATHGLFAAFAEIARAGLD